MLASLPAPRGALSRLGSGPAPADMERLLIARALVLRLCGRGAAERVPSRRWVPAGGRTSRRCTSHGRGQNRPRSLGRTGAFWRARHPPPPARRDRATWARVRWCSRGRVSPSDPSVRLLVCARLAISEGRSYDAPSQHAKEVALPVNFPRWRYFDAPVLASTRPSSEACWSSSRCCGVSSCAAIRIAHTGVAIAPRRARCRLSGRPGGAGAEVRDHVPESVCCAGADRSSAGGRCSGSAPAAGRTLVECLAPHGGPVLATQNEKARRRPRVAAPPGDGRRKDLCVAVEWPSGPGGRECAA